LIVLFAEDRRTGHDEIEELENDRRHAPEVARPVLPFQDVLEVRGLDQECLRLRIDFAFVRREHDVHAGLLQTLAVFLERPWIAVEILARTELQAVYEDADDRTDGARLGNLD